MRWGKFILDIKRPQEAIKSIPLSPNLGFLELARPGDQHSYRRAPAAKLR